MLSCFASSMATLASKALLLLGSSYPLRVQLSSEAHTTVCIVLVILSHTLPLSTSFTEFFL